MRSTPTRAALRPGSRRWRAADAGPARRPRSGTSPRQAHGGEAEDLGDDVELEGAYAVVGECRYLAEIATADPAAALDHFENLLAFETDCRDVHAALAAGQQDFVVLTCAPPRPTSKGTCPALSICRTAGSWSAPSRISRRTRYLWSTAAGRIATAPTAAVQLSRLGRKVKKMLGGIHGWHVERFATSAGER